MPKNYSVDDILNELENKNIKGTERSANLTDSVENSAVSVTALLSDIGVLNEKKADNNAVSDDKSVKVDNDEIVDEMAEKQPSQEDANVAVSTVKTEKQPSQEDASVDVSTVKAEKQPLQEDLNVAVPPIKAEKISPPIEVPHQEDDSEINIFTINVNDEYFKITEEIDINEGAEAARKSSKKTKKNLRFEENNEEKSVQGFGKSAKYNQRLDSADESEIGDKIKNIYVDNDAVSSSKNIEQEQQYLNKMKKSLSQTTRILPSEMNHRRHILDRNTKELLVAHNPAAVSSAHRINTAYLEKRLSVRSGQTGIIDMESKFGAKPISKQERDEMVLKIDEHLETPDELLDSINPYEIQEQIKKTELPVLNLFGDTMGIAGNELKEMASRNPKTEMTSTSVTKEVESVFDDYDDDEILSSGTPTLPTLDIDINIGDDDENDVNIFEPSNNDINNQTAKRPSTTGLIEELNENRHKRPYEPVQEPQKKLFTEDFTRIVPPTTGINIHNTQILGSENIDSSDKTSAHDSGENTSDDDFTSKQIEVLTEKRKRKIKDFVLEELENENAEEAEEEEFESEDETDSQIWEDLCYTRKSLKLRTVLMVLLTAVIGAVTILGDVLGNWTYQLFGANVSYIDRAFDPQGFVYFNMIFGVIAIVICSSVILNGISKLLRGKGDCDSFCSVFLVLALLGCVLHLVNSDYLQRGLAFIYIFPAIVGLLFNTLGKLVMIVRTMNNFRFVSSEDDKYYADIIEDAASAGAFTKGLLSELPCLAVMRKTEILTDFLRNSYCDDKADKLSRILTPAAVGAAILLGVVTFFIPAQIEGLANNMYWATSAALALFGAISPLSILFIVNLPLLKASNSLHQYGSVVLGYDAAEKFAEVNSVCVDASTLFPSKSVHCPGFLPYRVENSYIRMAWGQSIVLAASLAIESGSILSSIFNEMINHKQDVLAKIDNIVYEDNMGIMGWYGNKRIFLGNRDHMKHHDIIIPPNEKVKKYMMEGTEPLYFAVEGETVMVFYISLTANRNVKVALRSLSNKDIALSVRTIDPIVSVNKLSEVYDVQPSLVKIIPNNLANQFLHCTKFTPSGDGAIACNGSFSGFAKAITACKKIMRDITKGVSVTYLSAFIAVILACLFSALTMTKLLSPTAVIAYSLASFIVSMLLILGTKFKK